VAELKKEDLLYILEIILLNYEGRPLVDMISQVNPKQILLGKKVLEFIRTEWQKQ
jgi:hypothetical protein